MSTISVGSLPVIDELFEDDMVLVQAKDRTGLLKFSDLVVGEQQVSFYQEIVNARNNIAGVSQAVQQNTANITTNADLIAELQQKSSSNAGAVENLETTTTSLQDQTTNMQSSLSAVTTLANSVLNTSIVRLSDSTAANTELSTQYTSLTSILTGAITSINEQIQDLLSTVNSLNNTLYVQQQQIDDHSVQIDTLTTMSADLSAQNATTTQSLQDLQVLVDNNTSSINSSLQSQQTQMDAMGGLIPGWF